MVAEAADIAAWVPFDTQVEGDRHLVRGFQIVIAGIAAASVVTGAWAGDKARTISFYHIHTKETLTVTYKRSGKFVPEAMKKIDWFMRDWRKDVSTKIDPNTIDIIWEMHKELGSKMPVHVISGHRSKGTNDMLRRTRGGQARRSQHITGKAIDVAFPDIPVRQLRYSAMIRERGGVGYYPTSAIPFVHVDTARVRHWPRMGRHELALLFPSGRTKHRPPDGRPITRTDAQQARKRAPNTAKHVAQFFDVRNGTKPPVLIADAKGWTASPSDVIKAPAPKPAKRPAKAIEKKVALAAAAPVKSAPKKEAAPRLISAPQLAARPTRLARAIQPAKDERERLNELVRLASLEPRAVRVPAPAVLPPARAAATPDLLGSLIGALATRTHSEPQGAPSAGQPVPRAPNGSVGSQTSSDRDTSLGLAESWDQAPEFDEDHPEELFYRPFPLAPLLTNGPSANAPELQRLTHPVVAETIAVLDDVGEVHPVRFRPGLQVAELMWSSEFRGEGGNPADAFESSKPSQPVLAERRIKTSGN